MVFLSERMLADRRRCAVKEGDRIAQLVLERVSDAY